MTEQGYSASGINDILREAKVPKGSFYHYFRDKQDFGDQLIDAYQDYFSGLLDRCFKDTENAPLDRLQFFVDTASEGMARHGFRRGCLVGNLGQEMGALPQAFREKLIRVFEDWQERTANCLRLAQSEGALSQNHDVEALARFFWIGWEGAVLRAKLERTVQPLTDFSKGFFSMLESK